MEPKTTGQKLERLMESEKLLIYDEWQFIKTLRDKSVRALSTEERAKVIDLYHEVFG